MKDLYLLAAGLLTGLAIPASALSQLSIIQRENHQVLWDFKQDSQPTVGEKIVPTSNISLAELSNHKLQVPVTLSVNSNSQLVNHQLISGSQLYYQRLAALRIGHSYMRSVGDESQSLWESARKHQLTYQDWKSLLAMEAKAMAQGQGTNHLDILVGDSLSMWFPKEKLPAGKLWLNQGISGDTSDGILKRLSAFSETRPDVIYIMAGINDLRKGETDETILHHHRLIIRQLRHTHPKAQIIVQSILPTRLPTIPNSRIRQLNYQLTLIVKQEGANYFNLHNWFRDFQGNLRQDLTTDGLHLSEQGYEVWRSALEQTELVNTQQSIVKKQFPNQQSTIDY